MRWVDGVARPRRGGPAPARAAPAEGPYADEPLAALVLHIHREVIHHGAESACSATSTLTATDRKAR